MFIVLSDGQKTEVDECDKDLAAHSWHTDKDGYVVRTVGWPIQRTESIHRTIMTRELGRSMPSKEFVDHIDRNRLNNKRNNLRPTSNSQNACNRGPSSNNTTGYKGVTKAGVKWQAQIMAQGMPLYLGRYSTPEQAAKAYNDAARIYHGEYALLNDVD